MRTAAEKTRIVAERLIPGARVAEVARKHATSPWQIYDWRRRFRAPEGLMPDFATLIGDEFSETRLSASPGKQRRNGYRSGLRL
ncbi:transposase [Bradyrhizobium sp. sGM-13]|uniref:transposase n=1 Tax=Bradyrhizobium sp. sGM-13 TaxID=2831781 RepID=UPI001BD0A21C|nr:transposase [Bradyrhizobium sp. sGM-13]